MNRSFLENIFALLNRRLHRRSVLKLGALGLAGSLVVHRNAFAVEAAQTSKMKFTRGRRRGCFNIIYNETVVVQNASVLIETESGTFSSNDKRFTLSEQPKENGMRLDFIDSQQVCDITIRGHILPSEDCAIINVTVVNRSKHPLRLLSVEPLSALGESGGSLRFWDKAADIKILTDSWERCYGDASVQSLVARTTLRSAWDVHLFDQASNVNCNLSFYEIPSGKLSFHLTPQAGTEGADLIVRSDTHAGTRGVVLQPNASFACGEIMIRFTKGSVFDALESYAELIATRNRIPRPTLLPVGWVDWYIAKGLTAEKDILDSIDFLSDELKDFGLEYVQLDSGWQLGIETAPPPHNVVSGGPWVPNSRFSRGMKWYADRIKERGLTPGIWIRPFQMVEPAPERREHPEWFNKKGSMDFSNPQVLERVRSLMHVLVNEWGYKYVKYDFPSYDLFDEWGLGLYDNHWGHAEPDKQSVTGIQAYANALEVIRKAAPEVPLLACNSAMAPTLGQASIFRIGDDVGNWERTFKYGVRSAASRYYTNGVYWTNDPDVLLVREPFTLDQAQMWASIIALSGGSVFISEKLHELPAERLDIVKKAIPVYRNSGNGFAFGRPVDLLENNPPELWNLEVRKSFDTWNIAGVFNWSEEIKAKTISFKSLGLSGEQPFAIYDFWQKRFLGIFRNSFDAHLNKNSCSLLAIHSLLDRPQFISSNRHITQGGIDLDDIQWDDEGMKLSGASRVVKDYPYLITIRVPEGFTPSMYEGCENVSSTDSRILLIRIYPQATGVMKWSVTFKK